MLYDIESVNIESVCTALNDGFKSFFKVVSCKVVNCPNLKSTPYNLTLEGLNGAPILCDFGSFGYLLPVGDKTKRYDLKDAFNLTNTNSGSLIGAGAGPHFINGFNSEMVINLAVDTTDNISNESYYGSYDKIHNAPLSSKANSTQFAMLGQLLLCEGRPGAVIELTASHRTQEGKFDAILRDALAKKFNGFDLPVGVGGVILQETGKSMFHVIPDFCNEPLDSPEKVKNWLKFFEMDAPVVSVGTALSHDPKKWGLRLEHFHCFNQDRSRCGHCHFDTKGADASYRAYFVVAEKLLRVDQPPPK